MMHAGIGIRCFGERFDVMIVPLVWQLRAAIMGTAVNRIGNVIVGPLSLSATTYHKAARSFDGPAIALYCGWSGWQYELRLVPLLWRLRRKMWFISIGPIKLMRRPTTAFLSERAA